MTNATRRRQGRSNGTAPPLTDDRPVPHAPDAEAAVIGAALVWSDVVGELASVVGSEDFWAPSHQHIWDAVVTLHRAGQRPDPLTVADQLRRAQLFEAAGGPNRLNELQGACPTPGNAERYAVIVAEHAAARRAMALADEIRLAATALEVGKAVELAQEASVRVRVGASAPSEDVDTFLAGDDPDYRWLVPGLIERGDRVIIVGPEGRGKSTLLRQIAVQVAAGVVPFTGAPNEPARVLFLDCENSRRQLRRMFRHLRSLAELDPDRLRIEARTAGINLLDPSDTTWLHGLVAANRPDLVVAGPIYKLAASDGHNPEEVAHAVTSALDAIRARWDCAIVLEAHQPHANSDSKNRPARPIDSSRWLRWPEFGIALDVQDRGQRVVLKRFRGDRDERAWPSSLVWGTRDNWPWVVDPREPQVDPLADVRAEVLAVLAANGPLSGAKLESACQGKGVRIREARDALVRDGEILTYAGSHGATIYAPKVSGDPGF